MNFGKALESLELGGTVTRENWNNPSIKVKLQVPDENSKMTESYLYMEKSIKHPSYPESRERDILKRFPLDLSCESVLAKDWIIL